MDSEDAKLEGGEHYFNLFFRFNEVTHMETNSKNTRSNILILGNSDCFHLFS